MLRTWPDPLASPEPHYIADLMAVFWLRLAELPDLVARGETLLSAECCAEVRSILIQMVLAANGVMRPNGTKHLNEYLSPAQRSALEKTLRVPTSTRDDWIGQAVAMVVIYRWYAPQLVERFGAALPAAAEQDALRRLETALPDWPRSITTD